MRDMRNAFGRAPETFKYSVAGALNQIQREEKQRRRVKRPVLVLAAVLALMLAGVVYAAVYQYRLANYYEEHYATQIAPEVQEQMLAEIPQDAVEVGPLLFRVQEVYLEDGWLLASVNLATKDGTPAYFIATDVGPEDQVGSFTQENRFEDTRSYLEAAREDGYKLFYVNFGAHIPEYDGGVSSLEFITLPDGTSTFVSNAEVAAVPEGTERVTVEYYCGVVEIDLGTGEYLEDERIRHTFQEEVSVHRAESGEGFPVGKTFAGTSIRLDEVAFTQTSLGIQCEMYCTRDEGAEGPFFGDDNDIWLTLVDAQGEYLDPGAGNDDIGEIEPGRWRVIRSMRWTEPPASGEAIYVKCYDVMADKFTYDIMPVNIP